MADVNFTDLPVAPSLAGTEVIPIDVPDGHGGYTTERTTTGVIADLAVTPSGVTPGTYGDGTSVPQITVDEDGFVTVVANVPIETGSGSVTEVGVASDNGFSGTVQNPTTTPVLSISTTVTGLLKGDGSAITSATSGVDFAPGTSALSTGILKNTTATGALSIATAPDFPTLNQNTTGSAAKWTTARALAGNSVDGSAAVPFANDFIVRGTADDGLPNAQFMGALETGLVKNTTSTGTQSIAVEGTDYQGPITLTTTGSSGAATFENNTLNIPSYPGGTVSSVGITVPTELDITDSPVTGSGTMALSWASQSANRVFAGPASGAATTPGFRAMVGADLPGGTTGSGAVVLAQSASLTAPDLGTPAAVVLTNATGLPTSALPTGSAGLALIGNGTSAPSYQGFEQSGTGAVTRTWNNKAADIVSVRDFGAVGDGVTDDAAAFRGAAAAVANGGTVLMPPGNYLLNSVSNGAILDFTGALGNKAVSWVGGGWNLNVGSTPTGTILQLGPDIADTTDFFHAAGSDQVSGVVFKDFALVANGGALGTPMGRHGIFIDATASTTFYYSNAVIDHFFIDQMKTGESIVSSAGGTSTSGAFAYSSITRSYIETIWLLNCGDNILVDHNIVGFNSGTGANSGPAVYAYNIPGAANLVVTHNVIANQGGMIVIDGGTAPIVRDNEFEQTSSTENLWGSLIDFRGQQSTVVDGLIVGNSISQNSTKGAYTPVLIENASGTIVDKNRIDKPTDSTTQIVITSSASNTTVGINNYKTNGAVVTSGAVTDSGTATTFLYAQSNGTWTPVVTAGSGSITSYTASGTFVKTGKFVQWESTITISDNGTGATDLSMTLPSSTSALAGGYGKETTVSGAMCQGFQYAIGATMHITKYDNSYPGGTGAVILLAGSYTEA